MKWLLRVVIALVAVVIVVTVVGMAAATADAPSHLVTVITDKDIPFGGSWDYRIVPDGTGTRITITENGQVYNPIFRFVSKYVLGHTATLDKYLTSLAAKVGDKYTPSGNI